MVKEMCSDTPGSAALPEVRCKTLLSGYLYTCLDLRLTLGVLISPKRDRNETSGIP